MTYSVYEYDITKIDRKGNEITIPENYANSIGSVEKFLFYRSKCCGAGIAKFLIFLEGKKIECLTYRCEG